MATELRVGGEAAGIPYNSEALLRWARFARGPVDLQGLDLAFYGTGSLRGYRALAREYMESSSRTREKSDGGKPGDRVTAITDDGHAVQTNRAAARKLGWRVKVD